MSKPGEHKTVQSRILAYAQEIGWCYVSRAEAETRRGFDSDGATPEDHARTASLYFGDLLHSRVRAFNPKYKEAEGALVGEFQRLNADIAGNRDFLTYLRNQGKFFCAEENRELDLTLIDYGDLARRGPGPSLSRRDTGGDGAGDDLFRHRGHRLRLRGDLEHGAAKHFQLEARRGGQPGSQGEEFLRRAAGAALVQGFYSVRGERGGTAQVHPDAASDGRDGQGGGAGWSGTRRGAARLTR
jgi:hypothetical protein